MIESLLQQRKSVRAYRREPAPKEVVEELLVLARTAPSGGNLQPGRFYVLTGQALADLIATLQGAIADGVPAVSEYSYFPTPMPGHLKKRQRETGYALYDALGIARRDTDLRRQQFGKNYRFFDAPVGMVVTIERSFGKGGFMDLGMALQSLFIAANAKGLGVTGIGALANHGDVVHTHLQLAQEEMVVCGIALGFEDGSHPVNKFRTSRLELAEYSELRGFDD